MKPKLQVLDQEIATTIKDDIEYINITDIARYKNPDRTDIIIGNWLRNRNTIEFLGIWEQLNNPDFKPIEFDGFKKVERCIVWGYCQAVARCQFRPKRQYA